MAAKPGLWVLSVLGLVQSQQLTARIPFSSILAGLAGGDRWQ